MTMPTSLAADDRPDPSRWTARVHPVLAATEVVIVGWHSAFASPPAAGTKFAVFPETMGIDFGRRPVMGLVRVEHAALTHTMRDGIAIPQWVPDPFRTGLDAVSWRVMPAEPDGESWVIAGGAWTYSGHDAVLPATVVDAALSPPPLVRVYGHNPHTGDEWIATS
ncbi:hypothetical protein ACWF9G_27285 [Nocardia sp. NPDC055029]